jgi:lipoprotein-anchoring transpeptidase ErfK/SrfK
MLSGCSSTTSETSKTSGETTQSATSQDRTAPVLNTFDSLPKGDSLVATAKVSKIEIHRSPGGAVSKSLSGSADSAGPLVFLVTDERDGWLKVHLPIRPNGATGWVSVDQVTLSTTPYRLVVSMQKHRLDLFQDGQRKARYPVGVGKSTTPTPPGEYYLAELIQPPNPNGVYGPYAFGLSAYSETLKTFAGGPGQLGLHGTDEPDKVGTDVSHGCLRLKNAVITELATTLPLGTPIQIEA